MSQFESFRLNGHQDDQAAIQGVVDELIRKDFFNNIRRDWSKVTPKEVIREFINDIKKLQAPYSYPNITRGLNIPVSQVYRLIIAFQKEGILEAVALAEG